MVFVRDALQRASPEALRLYLLDLHYRKPFDHDEVWLGRSTDRQAALAERFGDGPIGPIGRDASTRAVMGALDADLDTARAVRELERALKVADERSRASLRAVARTILGIF
jgi:cysteinyl-tRNA synthetase